MERRQLLPAALMVALSLSTAGILVQESSAATQPSHLEFYMYIAVQNRSFVNNPAPLTAILSASPDQYQPFAFGDIHTFDNPLTSTPSLNNTLNIGHVQGWYGNTGQSILTLFLVQTFSFTTAHYNATDTIKYAPIVGGTGDFAFARGVAEQTLVSTNIIDSRTVSWFHYKLYLKY